MKRKILLFTYVLTVFAISSIIADEENIFLKKLIIEGNSVTRESYVRSFITLKEGKIYKLDTIIDEINVSRENLERTNLFSSIFFDDELDEENNLTLTIRLKEKNYLLFGPDGYMTYQNNNIHINSIIYISHVNFLGRAAILSARIPVYENLGFIIHYQDMMSKVRYTLDFEYIYPLNEGNSWLLFTPGAAYRAKENLFIGVNFKLNRNVTTSAVFSPYLEAGIKKRHSYKVKKWYFTSFSPYYGYNFDGSSLYGLESNLNHNWDLLFKIVYAVMVEVNIQGGEVPDNLILKSKVRGTHFDIYRGNKQVSISNELHIPLPWNTDIVIVPFLDSDLIGYDYLQFLIGGGIGLHWFSRYQDPLIVEVAFGKGVMLNFQKRF